MQRGVRHGHAADADRLEAGHGGQRAGAADLELDRFEHRLRLLRWELEGDRPTRRARERAEGGLLVETVDLEDRAVDLDRQIAAFREQRVVIGRRVGRRDGALLRERRAQTRHLVELDPRGLLVLVDQERVAAALGHLDRDDLRLEAALFLRRLGALVALGRKRVLVFAGEPVLLRDQVAAIAHVHLVVGIPEPVVHHRIDDLLIAHAVAAARTRHEVGRVVIDSMPPATTTSASPTRSSRRANITAWRPEPQTLLIVMAPALTGRPALIPA